METVGVICVVVICLPLFIVGGLLLGFRSEETRFRRFDEQGIPIQSRDADMVRIPVDHGTLFLSIRQSRSSAYTVMEVPHVCESPLAFTIVRRGLGWGFSPGTQIWGPASGARLGVREIEVGDPQIDPLFRVRCNDETVVRALLADAQVRRMLLDHRPAAFGIVPANTGLWPLTGSGHPRHREGAPALILTEGTVIEDAGRVKALIALCVATRQALTRLGAIR
jgi:hypothetical protein